MEWLYKDHKNAWSLVTLCFQTMRLSLLVNCETKLVDGRQHCKSVELSKNSLCSKGKYCFVKLFSYISKYETRLQCKMYFLLRVEGHDQSKLKTLIRVDEVCLPGQVET